jgi:condensation domain-containing protein
MSLTVPRRPPGEPRVTSFAQDLLWYVAQAAPGSAAYNIPLLSRLDGKLDIPAFERALDALIDRHDVLRTVFLAPNGTPKPVVLKRRPANLQFIDLRQLPEAKRETEARSLAKRYAAEPVNLGRDPMFRFALFALGEEEFLFYGMVHHIVFEGSSIGILYRDVAAFYNAFVSGGAPNLPELQVDYSDFAAWQRGSLQGERLEALNQYWKKRLAGAPLVNLPLDSARPAVHTMRGAKHFFAIPPDLLAGADTFFRQHGTTSYRALCAVFHVLLRCYSGSSDISIGTPCASRCRGIDNLIGFFVNTVVLRVDSSNDPTFSKLIRKVDAALHGAISHSDLPFSKIVEAVQPPRDPSRTPLFQVNFRAPQQPYPRPQLVGVTMGPVEVVDNDTAKFDLAIEVGEFAGEANYVEYCSDLFREPTILEMEKDFFALLRGVIAQPDVALSQLPIVREIAARMRDRAARQRFAETAAGITGPSH